MSGETGVEVPVKTESKLISKRQFLKAATAGVAIAQTTRGRERYLKENTFNSSQKVKVLESSRMGDHLALPGPRARQTALISSKYLQRGRK